MSLQLMALTRWVFWEFLLLFELEELHLKNEREICLILWSDDNNLGFKCDKRNVNDESYAKLNVDKKGSKI